MKKTVSIIPVVLLLFPGCSRKSSTDVKDILPTYVVTDKKDTINYVDVNGLKQGHWIIYKVGSGTMHASVNCADSTQHAGSGQSCTGFDKLEEGEYTNDKKTGYWKRFLENGSVKDSVNYN